MRRTFLILGLVIALTLAALWATGMGAVVQHWVLDQQRAVQTQLAGAVRALRAGHPGALAALLAVCFGYGVAHAAGPGHGKLVIGGYGVAQRIAVLPLAGIALAASLAQAAVAVTLVGTGVLVLGWSRDRLEGVNEQIMAPLGTAAIAGVGLWLMLRGWRAMARAGGSESGHRARGYDAGGHAAGGHDAGGHGAGGHRLQGHPHQGHANHAHGPADHVHDAHCGHAHGPTLDQVTGLANWRDAVVLIGGIALRPCTGALFLLILCFAMGIGPAGVAGAFAMGLGTACVTIAVAALAVWAREGMFASLPGAQGTAARLAVAVPVVQILAGAGVAAVALSLLWQGL